MFIYPRYVAIYYYPYFILVSAYLGFRFAWRAVKHDLSKYRWSEAKYYATVIFDLRKNGYLSQEYKECLKAIKPAIALHYGRNRHHPQHFAKGMDDMSPMDEVEMMADWCAAVRRHENGNVWKSLQDNQERFKYSDEKKEDLKWLLESMTW